ncbi:MAG: hypothetical protein HUK00_04175, partial [Bacteroidaceae bacterium]|nr:hypothetical protein [Bacteroidaceae bacterium]
MRKLMHRPFSGRDCAAVTDCLAEAFLEVYRNYRGIGKGKRGKEDIEAIESIETIEEIERGE